MLGDSLGDGHNEVKFGLDGFDDSGSSEGRGHVDHGGVGSGLLDGFPDCAEDGKT